MTYDFGQDDRIRRIRNAALTDVRFRDIVLEILESLFESDNNPFGSAATRDAAAQNGGASGQLATLTTDGRLGKRNLPADTTYGVAQASLTQAGIAEIATEAEIQAGIDNTKIVTPRGLLDAQITPAHESFSFSGVNTFDRPHGMTSVSEQFWYLTPRFNQRDQGWVTGDLMPLYRTTGINPFVNATRVGIQVDQDVTMPHRTNGGSVALRKNAWTVRAILKGRKT